MIYLWVAIIIVSVIADIATSLMLFVWYGVGALVAAILELYGFGFGSQVVAFAVVGSILTIIFYPIFKRKLKNIPKTLTREEQYIGTELVAKEDIDRNGRIMVDGAYWSVINEGEPIKAGNKIKIIAIKGTKFLVKGE
ncbi:NfeD family protein [Inconstantimicrobium mannanitabidum]|uniref:Uncharacterized protein n=1 Tax=Inconstantimicrobium mannanitabidum TaxID=1604901 RepID=A0ACB5R7H4_9CLOT|nr:NfeD family protein [Clostridium sp. TW13]GKX65065.1 hypothetical protein rsdtw13_03230 [Clostridium sp. TW13]